MWCSLATLDSPDSFAHRLKMSPVFVFHTLFSSILYVRNCFCEKPLILSAKRILSFCCSHSSSSVRILAVDFVSSILENIRIRVADRLGLRFPIQRWKSSMSFIVVITSVLLLLVPILPILLILLLWEIFWKGRE